MFPALHMVQWSRFNGEGEDSMGNDASSWEPPVERAVISWESAKMNEVLAEGNTNYTSRSVTHLDLKVPPDFGAWSLQDKCTLPNGEEYEVVGGVDLSGGWHGWHPGDVIRMKRVG